MTNENETTTLRPFEAPTFTQISNYALDHIMPSLSGNQWKILCVIIRATWGWEDRESPTGRREEDVLSYSQLQERSGIKGNITIKRSLDVLLEQDYITRRAGAPSKHGLLLSPFAYRLNTDFEVEIMGAEIDPIESTGLETNPTRGQKLTPSDTLMGSETEETERKVLPKKEKEKPVLFQKLIDDWPMIMEDLKGSLTAATFNNELKHMKPVSRENGQIVLAVRNPAWVEARLKQSILRPLQTWIDRELEASDVVLVDLEAAEHPP